MSFSLDFRNFLESEEKLKPRTVKEYLYHLGIFKEAFEKKYKKPLIQSKQYYEISDLIIELSHEHQWAQSTTYRLACILIVYFRWLERLQAIEKNPFPHHSFRKGKPRTPEFFDPEQVELMLYNPHNTILYTIK